MRFDVYRDDDGFWYWNIVVSEDGIDRKIAICFDGYPTPGNALRELTTVSDAVLSSITRVRLYNSEPNPDRGYVEVGLATAKGIALPEPDGEPTIGSESVTETAIRPLEFREWAPMS